MRGYKLKLNIKRTKQLDLLKSMSGTYRAIFNSAIDLQTSVLHSNASKGKKYLVSGTDLYKHFRDRSPKLFPFLEGLDKGILSAACFHASVSFKNWWEKYGPDYEYRQPKHLSKKDLMHFRTDGNVRVFYDFIEVPKLGKIKLFEKGYLPQGKKYTNVTFSHDGNDWFISLVALDEKEAKEVLTGETVVVDFTNEGNLQINNEIIQSIVESESYKKEIRKHKKLIKQLRRQKSANLVQSSNNKRVVRCSRNMIKTRAKIAAVETRMENLRKDQFRKVASRVAITKPKKLLALSRDVIRQKRQGGLSLQMREKHTLDFLNVVLRKAELIGTKVVRHKSLLRFSNTASGLGVEIACGELVSSQIGEITNSVKQELCCA